MDEMTVTVEEKQKFMDLINSLINMKNNEDQVELIKSSLNDLKKIYVLFMIRPDNALIFLDIIGGDLNDTPREMYKKAEKYYDNANEQVKLAIAVSCINQLFENVETFIDRRQQEDKNDETTIN